MQTKISPKDFFLQIGMIAGLYAIVISLLNLIFSIINHSLPIETNYYQAVQTYSVPVAVLIIIFPIFLLLSWLLNKDQKLFPEKKSFWLRKWTLYLTLFIASIVIIIDLVVILISFLSGDVITTNFILKFLSVLIVTSFVFWYYISDIKNKLTTKTIRLSAIISTIVILAMIVLAFTIMGSPKTQRLLRIDEQKVADLQNIQWQIVNYWQSKEMLPNTLSDLENSISGYVPNDPQTGEPYEYYKDGNLNFRLCAKFNLESRRQGSADSIANKRSDSEATNWNHDAGNFCFERDIDPDLYAPRKI